MHFAWLCLEFQWTEVLSFPVFKFFIFTDGTAVSMRRHFYSLKLSLFHSFRVCFCFFLQIQMMIFHESLSDSKSPQISWTLLSIRGDFNRAMNWMISIRPLIFCSSSLFSEFLRTVLRVPTTIDMTVSFVFHSFFLLSFKVLVFVRLLAFFHLNSAVYRQNKSTVGQVLFFILIITRSGLLARVR